MQSISKKQRTITQATGQWSKKMINKLAITFTHAKLVDQRYTPFTKVASMVKI